MKFKKALLLTTIMAILSLGTNVYACGEIKELSSDIGTISGPTEDSEYTITVPVGTKEIILSGSTDYTWVSGYAPRKVSTSEPAELKVDGAACGYGIYTYFIKFKTMPNIIAENTDTTEPDRNEVTPTQNEDNNGETTTPSNSSIKLKTLTIEGYSLDFDPSKYDYEIEVDNEVDKLDIKTSLEEGTNATVVISDNVKKLEEGINNVTISVTGENSDEVALYTIKVNRQKLRSSNNYLASITVSGYQLNFDPSQTSYSLSINKETTLNFNVITESELASYEILGNNNLDNGSTIIIKVTAEDESTKDYVINISKSFDIMDYWIYIVIGLLVLLFILLIIIMRQKKDKKPKDEKNEGPSQIDTLETTAGTIQTQTPPVESFALEENQETVTTTPGTPVDLQIIEPTNIEETASDLENKEVVENFSEHTVDENTNPTEIFKL